MEVTMESEFESEDSKKQAEHPLTLTVIANEHQNAQPGTADEKDWDPYIVWKKLIRRGPDAS
ncbi:MAG: hypothetical protein HKN59_01790 [Gammaproteobacteria bacterium]|nr:hypothetical protein [Gammaproteobacteria bacterium]